MKMVTKFTVREESVECPYCGHLNNNLLGDPRGKEAECAEVISVYSRAQAIADEVLVDVSVIAREAGFRIPVALTAGVFRDCVEWHASDNETSGAGQDQEGRLWDVVFMAYSAAKAEKSGQQRVRYSLYRVPRDGKSHQAKRVDLDLHIGGGDQGEPVITIMLPEED